MQKGIPVLMYHAITPTEEEVGYVHITLAQFTQQMQWLAAEGYRTISVSELLQPVGAEADNRRKVVLTFDDGYVSLYQLVRPVLHQYGFRATLFLTTAAVGADSYEVLSNFEHVYPSGDRPLRWQELQEMERMGWDIQPHGHRHLPHNCLTAADLHAEILESKQQIELHLQKQTRAYAFPYGRYNPHCLEVLSALGFTAAFTVVPGLTRGGSTFQIPRVFINRFDNLAQFQRKVQTGYRDRREQLKAFFMRELYKRPLLKDALKRLKDKFRDI